MQTEEMQPIQNDWQRPQSVTPCSQESKERILKEMKNEIYLPASSQKKGSALLITNIEFDYKELKRHGAEKDEVNMEWLLRALGYNVVKHTNLSGKEIDEAVKNFSKYIEYQDVDSTFVVIMSHGKRINNNDAIVGVRYHPDRNPNDFYFVDKTFSHLNNCRALIDKPKVILIQACRGEHKGGVYVSDSVPGSGSWKHREKDFVCFKSTLPNTQSYRDPKNGSFFILYIVHVFSKWAHNDDIMELFRKVTKIMADDPRFSSEEKLLPCIERTSLEKKFYLFPQEIQSWCFLS